MADINKALLAELYAQRAKARDARAEWERYEKQTTAKILAMLGYERDPESRPDSTSIPGVLRVEVSPGTHLDQKYLKEHYPAIAAECERTHWKTYIRPPE